MRKVGCGFRLRARWKTASHFGYKFRDALSAEVLNRKLHPIPKANSGTHLPQPHPSGKPFHRKALPTLNTSSERMRACCPEQPRHRGDGKSRPKRLQRLCPQVSRKKPRELRGFHICIVLHEGPRTAKLLSQHGLLGSCGHVVQVLLGGMVLCGKPVVEQHLKSGVFGILLEHGLVALLDAGPILPWHIAQPTSSASLAKLEVTRSIICLKYSSLAPKPQVPNRKTRLPCKAESNAATEGVHAPLSHQNRRAPCRPRRRPAPRAQPDLHPHRRSTPRHGQTHARSLQSALDRARNHPGITALAVNHQRARHSHVASFPPKLKPLMQFIR